jgi:hypothetical protein
MILRGGARVIDFILVFVVSDLPEDLQDVLELLAL